MENKLILWDIDGTLLHCGSNGTQALNETFLRLYNIGDAFSGAAIGGALDSIILENAMERFNIDKQDKEKILTLYIQVLEDILEKNDKKKILPGVKEILEYINTRRHIYGCLLTSNFKAGADAKLKSLGLLKYFSTGGYGDISGEKWHAAADAVNRTEQYYGIRFKKENIYIIGDTWYDIECARKLGAKSIAVATGWMSYEQLAEHQPDHIFKDLADYRELIRIIDNGEPEIAPEN